MSRRTKEDWTMSEWRDYYEGLQNRAYQCYQETGERRYDQQEYKYSKIVDAFNGYLELKNDVDTERVRRKRNIEAYADQHVYKDTYSKNEVLKMLHDVSAF